MATILSPRRAILNRQTDRGVLGYVRNFSPRFLPGLAAWYDAGDVGTVLNTAGAVSQWSDKSGFGRNLLQATGASQPTYSIATRTLTFDGTDDFLKTAAFTLGQPTTVYFVGSQVSWANTDYILDGFAINSGAVLQQTLTPNIDIFAGGSLVSNNTLAVAQLGLLRIVFNGTSSSFGVNGAAAVTGNSGSASMGGLTVGCAGNSTGFSNITANEIAIYNVAHNEEQQAAFWRYAQAEWSITP